MLELNKIGESKEAKMVSKTSLGGSVLMEKLNENLETTLKAFEGKITPKTILPKNLKE